MAGLFYGWWVVAACFPIAFYIGGALYYGFTAFFEPIVEEFGWSYAQVSLAFSLRGLEIGILAPITGFLVDRFGSRKLVVYGVMIIGFGLIVLSLTQSLAMFYMAFVLLALGTSGCASNVLMTAVAQWFRRKVGKAMGILVCGFGAGGLLIPLIVWLIDRFEWRMALVILGLLAWVMGIPLALVIRDRPEPYGYLPDGETERVSAAGDGGGEGDTEISLKEALKSGDFWKIGIAEGIRMMILLSVVTHSMPYLTSVGMSRGSAAFVATCIPVLSIAGRFGFGWLADFWDKRYVLAALSGLFGLGTLTFAYMDIGWLVLPFLLLFSPAYGGTMSLRGATVREYFGRESFGRILGILMGLVALGGVIGPFAAGWTFDHWGSYRPVWFFFAVTSVIAMGLALRLRPPAGARRGNP